MDAQAPGAHAPDREPRLARYRPYAYLALGALTAPIFALTPLLSFMGWFLKSLVHEMGHCAVAWLAGMPAFPAISLEGHAAAMHSDPSAVLAVGIWIALCAGAWHLFEGRARWVVAIGVGLLYPLLAFTGAKEIAHLLAGHGGELAFAALCLWKTLDGGFTESRLERALYGTLGWYLLGSNVRLCLGLMTSATSRAEYADNGSFGLTNDYIRVAEDVLHWRLQSVALMMLVASFCVLPLAFALWRISSRAFSSLRD